MEHIDVLARDNKDSRFRMRTKLIDEAKEEIQSSEGCVIAQIKALKASVDYLGSNNFIFHYDTVAANDSILVLENTLVAPSPSSDYFPIGLP